MGPFDSNEGILPRKPSENSQVWSFELPNSRPYLASRRINWSEAPPDCKGLRTKKFNKQVIELLSWSLLLLPERLELVNIIKKSPKLRNSVHIPVGHDSGIQVRFNLKQPIFFRQFGDCCHISQQTVG